MLMRLNFQMVMLFCLAAIPSLAQNDQIASLDIGDPAPTLRIQAWLKGTPVPGFEKGKVYVIEFWATWCKPCKAAMPNLSALSRKFKDGITIIGIDSYEEKTMSLEKVKDFVDSMGNMMDYHVAADNSNFTVAGWLNASGEQGIPKSFVVNAEGRLAWIGHPKDLDEVLLKIVNNTWNIKDALDKRNQDRYLRKLDDSLNYELMSYSGDAYKKDYLGKPDSALLAINEIVRKEPKLKYAPLVASNTFSALLKTNQHNAYKYGRMVIVTPTYEEAAYNSIIDDIEWYSDKFHLSKEIYQLGTAAYQLKINQIPYPEIANMPKYYNNMARWYWHTKEKSKAINAQQKAIEALKNKKSFSKTEMAVFNSRLQQYKKM